MPRKDPRRPAPRPGDPDPTTVIGLINRILNHTPMLLRLLLALVFAVAVGVAAIRVAELSRVVIGPVEAEVIAPAAPG